MNKEGIYIEQYGKDFLLVKSERNVDLRAIGKAIFEKDFHFAEEVIITEKEICIQINEHFLEQHLFLITSLKASTDTKSKQYKLPVFFGDHEDWGNVLKHSGMSKDEAIETLLASKFSLSMYGFLPGFMYLENTNTSLHVPRKTTPSKYVKAGSIALGGKYMGLYAIESPGGWNVIGKTPLTILNLSELPPVNVNLGDLLILERVNESDYKKLTKKKMNLKTYNL